MENKMPKYNKKVGGYVVFNENGKTAITNDGTKGGYFYGDSHKDPSQGISAIVDNEKPILVEGNEVIINKKSVQSDKVLAVKGTPKEILSTINQLDGNGVAIGDSEAEILDKYRKGGKIGKYHLGGDINEYSVNEFEKYLEDKYNANIDLGDYKKYIYLSRISIPKEIRGLGIGTEIMNEIIAYADKNNRLVTLTPSTDYGATSISRLKEFYKNFGFIENKGKNKNFEISQLMYRLPENNKFKTGGEFIKRADGSYSRRGLWDNIRDNVGSGRKPTKQMLEQEAKIRAKYNLGGSIKPNFSKMSNAEIKDFYNSPEGKKLDAETYSEWKRLVNMTKSELEKFYNSEEGKKAGLTPQQASEQGIDSGRESARWIMKMKDIPYTEWSSDMWIWAKKQISFIKRMSGMKGALYDEKGNKTRKHTALLIWGNNPEKKYGEGGGIKDYNIKSFIEWFINWYKPISKDINISLSIPNELQPYKENDVVILDVFEKKNQNIDAKKYLKEIINKADKYKITIYLEPVPRHNLFMDNNEKKDKITTSYLRNYYKNFGFKDNNDNYYYSMKRTPNPEEKFRGGGELSQKALSVETNDLSDFVRKYFIKDGRMDIADAMQELFGNKRGKSIADEYRKRIGLHKKGAPTIKQLAHKLWEQHKDEVRENIDDSDFRNAIEEVLTTEYGVNSMIENIMDKSEEGMEDEETKYWKGQFDENEYEKNQYDEQLTDEEMSMIFRDMEQAERELAKGTEHEMEHLETLKKVAEHEITPEEGVVQTARTHITENPTYYEDLEKMEAKKEEIFTGKMDNGQPFMFFVGKEPKNGYKSENAKELYNKNGYWIDNQLGFDNLLTGYFKDYESMLDHTNPKYHNQLGVNIENEESIPDLIEGLKVLLEYAEGDEKTELENTIEGLKLLLEDEKFSEGGEFRMKKGGNIVFKPITTPL